MMCNEESLKVREMIGIRVKQLLATEIYMLVTQLCLILCDPMDCSLPGLSVHGVFLARILEWVAISFSWRSSQPRDQTHVSCLAGRIFITQPPGKPI